MYSELLKIREDTELLPDMFRQESKAKKKLEEEYAAQKQMMDAAAKADASLKKQVRDLQMEVERKKKLALQAIAARGQFKETLMEY